DTGTGPFRVGAGVGAVLRASGVRLGRALARDAALDGGHAAARRRRPVGDRRRLRLLDVELRRQRHLGAERRAEQPLGEADALQAHRHLGEPRGLHGAVGADPGAVRRGGGGVRARPAFGAQGTGAGGTGLGGGGLLRLHPRHVESLRPALAAAAGWAGAQSGAARPRLGLSPAAALPGLRRLRRDLRVRRCCADRGAGGRGLGTLGAALGFGGVELPDARHRARLLVGVLRAGLGRVLVLGPGGERLAPALAGRLRLAALRRRRGEAGGAEDLDGVPGLARLRLVLARHLPGAVGRAELSPLLRQRPDARRVHPRLADALCGRGLRAVRVAGGGDDACRRVRAAFPRRRAGAEQPAAVLDRGGGAGGHAVSDVRGPLAGAEDLGRAALLQHGPPAAGGAVDRRHGGGRGAAVEAGEAVPGLAAAVVGGARRLRRAAAVLGAGGRADRAGAGLRGGGLGGAGRSGRRFGPLGVVLAAPRGVGARPRPAALRLGRSGGARGHGCADPRLGRHGPRHRPAGAAQAGRERGTGRLHLAAGRAGERAGAELHRAARQRHRAGRRAAGRGAGAGEAELPRGPRHHHGGRHPHHGAVRPLRRAGRRAGRRGGAAAAPQPVGAVDLDRRRDHGAGRRAVAVRPTGARCCAGAESGARRRGTGV
ncbi:MAG: Cytochrome c heme lyase subunit CcmF, partial [uncultured Acetobacteraceae bacterium]